MGTIESGFELLPNAVGSSEEALLGNPLTPTFQSIRHFCGWEDIDIVHWGEGLRVLEDDLDEFDFDGVAHEVQYPVHRPGRWEVVPISRNKAFDVVGGSCVFIKELFGN